VRCPGLVAGTLARSPFGREEGPVITESVPHFESFVDCDCCAMKWVGSYKPASWPTIKRLGKDLVVCHVCAARHAVLLDMTIEQLFIEREKANVGVTYA
jgi:hypothetical protein